MVDPNLRENARIYVRPKLTQAEAVQLALTDYKTDAGAERYIRRLGGEGILHDADMPRLQRGCWRILNLMLDGAWHSWPEITNASGGLRSADRRRRQLIEVGADIERQDRGGGDFWYRLANADKLTPAVLAKARAMAVPA